MLLNGKIAVVTGATRGIGYATAALFAEHGGSVFLSGRSEQSIDAAMTSIRQSNPDADIHPLVMDVNSTESVRDAFQSVFKQKKCLDVMVANAGILDDALIGMVTETQVQSVFATNTFGVLYCAQYASRLMARNRSGSIINLSSIIGTNGNVGQAVYAGSKAAVIGITQSLAKELAPQNIRVNAVAPGFIDTEMARSIGEEKYAERLASIKMNRVGSPQEVAKVLLFLASDLSSYVTGQTIGVDGGMLI